jgi:hypothetical protein
MALRLENNALTLYGGTYISDCELNEETLAGQLRPNGTCIAYISSNYSDMYHEKFEHTQSKLVPKITTNRGRKKLPVKPKGKKRKGTGDKFDSCITFGIIYHGEVYGAKIFRRNSWNVYSVNGDDEETVRNIMDIAFAFINENIPEINIKINTVKINLRNMNFQYPLTSGSILKPSIINIHRFRSLLSPTDMATVSIDGQDSRFLIVFSSKSFIRLILNFNEKKYNANLSHSGKLYIYGGNDAKISRIMRDYIFDLIDANRDEVVMIGIPAMKGSEKKTLIKEMSKLAI